MQVRAVMIAALTLLLATEGSAFAQNAESYHVLFLGNSIFNANGGVLQPFEGFCVAEGIDCEAVSPRAGSRMGFGMVSSSPAWDASLYGCRTWPRWIGFTR